MGHKSADDNHTHESAYTQEVEQLAVWCSHNNLELNMLKTVEMTWTSGETPLHSLHSLL